jgi:hypothetical protein
MDRLADPVRILLFPFGPEAVIYRHSHRLGFMIPKGLAPVKDNRHRNRNLTNEVAFWRGET